MGSEDRQVKEKQFAKAKAVFEARKVLLTEKGLDEKAQGKDAVFKNLRAKVKKARLRIAAIDAAEAHVKEMASKDTKAENKSKKGAKGAKGAKSAKKVKPPKK